MKPQLTKTQLAHVLAGIAATEHKTALRYLDGEPVRQTVRERLDLAKQQWADMTTAYAAANASKGTDIDSLRRKVNELESRVFPDHDPPDIFYRHSTADWMPGDEPENASKETGHVA